MKTIATIAILAAVLLLAISALNVRTMPVTSSSVTTGVTDTWTVTGRPTLSARQIDTVLCTAQSPACGTGQSLYELSGQYGIDDIYALAFFKHESSFGKYGIARSNLGLGNIRCTAGYSCLSGFRSYSSWQSGYEDWYKLIAWYVQALHKRTVPDIIRTYAPSRENDTNGYIQSIETSVQAWRDGQ